MPPNITRPLAVTTSRTVISFFVSVPVLSDAMTLARSERLDGAEVTHDGVSTRHALNADRQDGGHDRRQPFRHRRDRERHAEDQHVEQRRAARGRARRR